MKLLLALTLTFCFIIKTNSQQNNTLFLMHDLPQANIVNPAVGINCKVFVGMPVLGSTHINAYSTGFALSDVLTPSTGDSLIFNPDETIRNFGKTEVVATEVHLSLLSAGYKHGANYFTLGINEKINSFSVLNKNALLLLNEGNSQFEGKNADMSGTRANTIHYREYALGWAREVNEKLSIGVRLKFLYGKADVYNKPIDLHLFTDATTFETYINGKGDLYGSLPVDITTDADGYLEEIEFKEEIDTREYLMNKANKGYGVDLGLVYQINNTTTLSASLLDIGYLKWKSDVFSLHSEGEIDITDELTDDGEIGDSIAEIFNPRVLYDGYSSPLAPALYIGVSKTMNEWLNAGAVFHTEMYKKRWHPSFTLSGNAEITKNIYGSASYTLQNGQFTNVGLGFGAKFGFLHFHAISDNVFGWSDLGGTRNANLRFGLSMLFGCDKEKGSNNDNGIRALPCIGDPYNAVKRKHRRRR
ncbi:DUF5723 family protein [Labilibacter marinus]|uniref:DUF5723 family protein n=1 Tax=Labilibacter marinus TaxID=1477105 RepID=UPI001179FC0A|nr:DUF5723 family protein [Labilibacter marinus]